MIENFGIGIDIVDINRFEKITYAEKPSFYNKLFTSSEIEYCLRFKTPAEHFAGKFAIKESLKKSIDEYVAENLWVAFTDDLFFDRSWDAGRLLRVRFRRAFR